MREKNFLQFVLSHHVLQIPDSDVVAEREGERKHVQLPFLNSVLSEK